MSTDPFSLLTSAQRDYLRGVHEGLTSKQIGQKLRASHNTINVEIGKAMQILGASSRTEAAAMLAVHEDAHGDSYERTYKPPSIATPPRYRPLPLPFATAGRPWNELTGWQRFFWICALAVICALMVGGLASGGVTIFKAASSFIEANRSLFYPDK